MPIVADVAAVAEGLIEDNLLLLRHVGEGFRTVFEHLAGDHYPLVINCFAGKDRTGLTSALILGAVGVPEDEIVRDYALSGPHMRRLQHIHRAPDDDTPLPDTLPDWLAATPATMTAILAAITEEWGSIPGYLAAIGVPPAHLRQITARLIVPAP